MEWSKVKFGSDGVIDGVTRGTYVFTVKQLKKAFFLVFHLDLFLQIEFLRVWPPKFEKISKSCPYKLSPLNITKDEFDIAIERNNM